MCPKEDIQLHYNRFRDEEQRRHFWEGGGRGGGVEKNLKCVGMEEGELKRIGRFLQ